MILIIAIISTFISIVLLLTNTPTGILFTLALKPIIDASWRFQFGGINCLQIIGLSLPLIVFTSILKNKTTSLWDIPLSKMATVYLISQFLGVIGILSSGKLEDSIEFFLRNFNGYVAFFMLPFYFSEIERFKKLLIFLLIAGLFPMATGIYQSITGHIWQYRQTVGITRYVGLYHDAFNIRHFGFQTLTAILLIWSYFRPTNLIKKTALVFYGLICCFVIYKGYSKAATVIFISWVFIWSLLNKKILILLTIPILIVFLNNITDNHFFNDIGTLFSKEIGVYEGSRDERTILAGRGFLWEEYWREWKRLGFAEQLLGSGKNPAAHNEYLRILYVNGIIGLLVFIWLILKVGTNLLRNISANISPIKIIGVMVFVMWLIDTIGLHPGLYPGYQWYVWGFVILSLKGIKGIKQKENISIEKVAHSSD